jgi:aspartyl-tRNA(Asn)/glutamyl-tRNA(Gln) amidotransferase subunit A
MSLAQTADAIARGRTSSLEVVRNSLERVGWAQPLLNAFVRIDKEMALAAAADSDARLARGAATGPLHGVPVAYKDMFDRTGQRCSFGSAIAQERTPDRDAAAVALVEQAGAVPLGALNMAEFALGPTGHNQRFGPCHNPWNLACISGGSSSGLAAAVAADLICGGLGSDTGGSVRIPASCCGVVGLKPTQGTIDARGAMPLAPSLDCIGPIAASAQDCAILHRVLAGRSFDLAAPAKATIAYPSLAIARLAHPDVAGAVDAAVGVLGRSAAIIERPLPDLERLHELADVIQVSESAAVHFEGLRRHRDGYGQHIRRRIETGLEMPAVAYAQALLQRPANLEAPMSSLCRRLACRCR